MEPNKNTSSEKLPFEAAIDKAGFGLYSYLLTLLTGFGIISFGCIGYGSTFLVPTSACELGTTASQQGMLAAGPVVGLILGGMGWGYLADTRGRRLVLMISLISSSVVNLIGTLSVNWVMLLIVQFLASLLASGVYSMSMTLLSESVPMAKRNIVVLMVSSLFLLAQGIMALLAIPIIPLRFSIHLPALGIYWNSWRTLMLVYSLPNLVTALCVFFMQESPKFVFSKGDEDRALQILRVIHNVNHLKSKEELQVKGLLKDESILSAGPSSTKDQIVPLFKAPLLKYTIIVTLLYMFQQIGSFVVWLPVIADQFIRIIQTGEGTDLTMCGVLDMEAAPADPDATPCALNETSMLMVLGIGVLQSVFNICISLLINTVGRRNIAMIVTSLCGISGILVNLVPNVIGSAVLFAIMLLGIVSLGLYTAIAVALFPTHLRAMAIALPMTGGRITVFASIQILNLLLTNNCDVGFYLFGSLFAVSAIVASFLPDDRRLQAPKPVLTKQESIREEPHQVNGNQTRNLAD
ncbi:arabinose-proton symporter-like [Anticarsia gemmatalis]|uniref:arabinose-proton symporter-like n=1 Tax=Anticarsia gemmatalis TaxID=129554 RepID=UPI003F772433